MRPLDALSTLHARLEAAELAEDTALDPAATVRAPRLGTPAPVAVDTQDLPRISLDLGAEQAPSGTALRTGRGRGDLEVVGKLGEGGMGLVLLARQRSLDREVAVKTLRPGASAGDREALLSEGAVTGYLEPPAIVPVHALGLHDDGRPLLVMKRVDGVAWRELLLDPAHPAWEGFGGDERDRLDGHLEILMQVCNALGYAHARGIVHRDVKPQNVLIGRFGDVYLADFGLAVRSGHDASAMAGTPGYMAPEMAIGGVVDERTDVYLVGATLHEVLTGRLRHEGANIAAVLARAAESAPYAYAHDVPADLAAIAARATARDPAERFPTVAELRRAIVDHRRHKSSRALSHSAAERLPRLRALSTQATSDEGERREADALIAEIRFALTLAREEWRENPDAVAGLAELDAIVELRHARAARLEALARDLDPAVAEWPRRFVVVVMSGAALSLGAGSLFVSQAPTSRALAYQSLLPFTAVLLGTLAFRRPLATSAFNRQTAAGLLAGTAAMALGAWLAIPLGVGPAVVMTFGSLVFAALEAFAATTLFPWMRWLAATMLVSAIGCALWPARAFTTFSIASSVAALVGILFGTRRAPASGGTGAR
jgi:serine/threonine-protein kinase